MSVHTIEAIPAQTIKTVALVGNVVTYDSQQWTVYAVEGYDYYAFQSGHGNGSVTCDFSMTPSEWHRRAMAHLLPMGAKIGEGLGVTAPVGELSKGVCLAKS